MRVHRVASADGATVTVHSHGSGPGVVILHGAGVTIRDYGRLALRLGERCSVHLYNRRGRADSAALTGRETAATDLEDLAAVLEHTGARAVFGHSGGGFVAMRAGLSLPVERIAVYDPAVALSGADFPRAFLEPFEAALVAGDPVRAFTLMGRDINRDSAGARLPLAVQEFITRLFLRTPPGRQMLELLPTLAPEIHRILDHEGPASDYAGVGAEVLLAYGTKSSRYFGDTCRALGAVLPRARVAPLHRASHNAANVASARFAAPFLDFFA